MSYLSCKSRYDKYPETKVNGFDAEACRGYDAILCVLKTAMDGKKALVVDCYPGVNDSEVLTSIEERINPDITINMRDVFYESDMLTQLMQRNLTDDRVRGVMYYGTVMDFIDPEKLRGAQQAVAKAEGTVLVYGFGAALVTSGDVLVYADMARWEIQLRYRKGMPNYKQNNDDEDFLRKYKRGFFVEWRIADRHKRTLYETMDFYLDTNVVNDPKMVSGRAFLAGLRAMTETPFRLVPYFDPGIWGGQWMKEICDLDRSQANFAWAFDGVPEENSIYLRYGDVRIESPAMNLTQYQTKAFLGEKNFARFGAEYPIRFDFLDTMGGQNLSLQVHPTTEYIHSKFGMAYTQDESYYILDAEDDGGVYLGLKEGIDSKQMFSELECAQTGAMKFDVEKYVNRFPAKKHDHFLIPAGTIHCSSKNCMVLEISATPYIFTFKLWDWDRVGLDGRPRPIHIRDGKQVIHLERTTPWVKENLLNRFEAIVDNDKYSIVRTGLHELEFIETHVITTNSEATMESDHEFAMCNLVSGEAAVVESPTGRFEPFTVHYAETFIIPANADDYTFRPEKDNYEIRVLRAFVRH